MDLAQYNQHLSTLGACFVDGQLQSFGNIEEELQHAKNQAFITPLAGEQAILSVTGEDAKTFLQGQFSNDINLVSHDNSQLSSYSSPQGRLFAIFRVLNHENDIHISLAKTLTDTFLKRLRIYIMRSKVCIEDTSEHITVLGVGGTNIGALLKPLFPQIPEHAHDSASNNGITIIRAPGSTPRYELYGAHSVIAEISEKLMPAAKPVSPLCWKWHDIQAAIPTVYPQTSEAFVAQMVNLELINAVNFKKGCYPGQEVIARLHYRGQSKRRMYPIHLETEAETKLGPGTAIYRLNNEKYQSIGEVVNAVRLDPQNIEVLAVLQNEHIEIKQCYLKQDEATYHKAKFKRLELPYPITE